MLPLLFLTPADLQEGQQYVAMHGVPAMADEAGHVIEPLRLMLHELTFVRQDADGTRRFLLDWKTPVSTKSTDILRKKALLRIVPSAHVSELRRLWVNRPLWCYGPQEAILEILSPDSDAKVRVAPGESMRIARIYQLAQPPSWDLLSASWGREGEDSWPGGPAPALVTDPLLVVYSMPTAVFSPTENTGWTSAELRRARDRRNYTPPFKFVMGSWLLDRMFSSVPPSSAIRKAIRRDAKASYGGNESFRRGLSRRELAWIAGWPKFRRSKATLLTASWWGYADGNFSYIFKGDRVIRFIKDPVPH